ncbi:MAG TPA: hypothetical protein VEN81_08970 [Planctomycetota bacterium]|nr:hypothetical protein [Planctomycetota bacterium]
MESDLSASGNPAPSLRRRIVISLFILFHFACVIAWILPKPSPVKSFLLGLKLPLPGTTRDPKTSRSSWGIAPREVVANYLWHTAQWQDWAMFAPNPLQTNRYLQAHVLLERGAGREYTMPRLETLGWLEGWLQKRYRKLKNRLLDEDRRELYEDLARFIARRSGDPGNLPVRVTVFAYESPLPRHDRPELLGPTAPAWVDYSSLLRDQARYSPRLLVDYFVRPGDLAR